MENMALLKPTSKIIKNNRLGMNAVDGDFDTFVATKKGEQWLSVDLQKETIVTHLTIFKKGKNVVTYIRIISYECVQKLRNLHIWINKPKPGLYLDILTKRPSLRQIYQSDYWF